MVRAGRWLAGMAAAIAASALAIAAFPQVREQAFWTRQVQPGPLSAGHAFIGDQCSACHERLRGVPSAGCISCHANEPALLSRQPTAFHASIGECAACHREHQGAAALRGRMDHDAFARASMNRREANLECVTCHETKDRHRGQFGRDCAACHATAHWTLPQFIHPSPASRECVQCHQAPPSHYMMHFSMVSQSVAGKPHATVRDCYECHRTTAWNDIPGKGFYKHH